MIVKFSTDMIRNVLAYCINTNEKGKYHFLLDFTDFVGNSDTQEVM